MALSGIFSGLISHDAPPAAGSMLLYQAAAVTRTASSGNTDITGSGDGFLTGLGKNQSPQNGTRGTLPGRQASLGVISNIALTRSTRSLTR
jgi:hypothetical protein